MTFVIEKQIPIPPPSSGKRGGSTRGPNADNTYPWAEMQVGDSILIPHRMRDSLSTSIRYHTKRHGMLFTQRKNDDGVRVWRLS